MNVTTLSTLDIKGGASKSAFNLHKSLSKTGINTTMIVQRKSSDDFSVVAPASPFQILRDTLLYPAMDAIPRLLFFKNEYVLHSPAIVSSLNLNQLKSTKPDIIQMHWIFGGFVRPCDLLKFPAPVVWTLHDMWPFCGSEHFVDEKNIRFVEGYTKNNRPPEEKGIDFNRWEFLRKKKIWGKLINKITFVTPSKWLATQAKKSMLLKNFDIRVFYNGLNQNIFKPTDKKIAREILNLPVDKRYVLFGATNGTKDPRKGFSYLEKAINMLSKDKKAKNIELIVFGCSEPKEKLKLNMPIHYVGRITDEVLLALVYSAADVMVVPSLMENAPATVMEPLACGTPVVGFNVGGVPEMIDHQKNGYVAKVKDDRDLLYGISWVIFNKNYSKLAAAARKIFLSKFTLDLQSKNYINLYKEIIKKNS